MVMNGELPEKGLDRLKTWLETSEVVTLESGQRICVHPETSCEGWCAIHRPLPGPWAAWPRSWRGDRGIIERTCPCGIGHPAAETSQRLMIDGPEMSLVHGCCFHHQCMPPLTGD